MSKQFPVLTKSQALKPRDLPNSLTGVIPPEAGWTEDRVYEVLVSYSGGNPVHKAFLFVGFLNDETQTPAGYSQVYNNNYEHPVPYSQVHYLEVVKAIAFSK